MVCAFCGAPHPDGANFCPQCGATVGLPHSSSTGPGSSTISAAQALVTMAAGQVPAGWAAFEAMPCDAAAQERIARAQDRGVPGSFSWHCEQDLPEGPKTRRWCDRPECRRAAKRWRKRQQRAKVCIPPSPQSWSPVTAGTTKCGHPAHLHM